VSETLKIIIAVLCIALLIYLAYSVYGLFTKKTAFEQAKSSLRLLELNVKDIEEGKKNESEILLESPNGWAISAWPYKDERNILCKKKYCVCICPQKGIFSDLEDYMLECYKNGICFDSDTKIETLNLVQPSSWYLKLWRNIRHIFGGDEKNTPIEINGLFNVKIVKEEGIILIKREK